MAEPSSAGPGMVSVHGDRIIFMATTLEEVRTLHMNALLTALGVANESVSEDALAPSASRATKTSAKL
jgi:hypothetical protein